MNVDTPAKEILFSTVRLTNESTKGTSVGTGFLMHQEVGPDRYVPFLVTNKHVLEGADRLTIGLIAKDHDSGGPKLGQRADVIIANPSWIGHPDPEVDVAVMPTNLLYSNPERQFVKSIPTTLLPPDNGSLFVDAVEEVTFIGYPNGCQDEVNLTPIVRRGITATPLELSFGGKPCFLVDGSVFGGSSGSPVFLLNEGMYRAGPLHTAIGTRRVLVGVVAATLTRSQAHPILVNHQPHVRIAQELNLGIVYSWLAIRQTIDVFLEAAGYAKPPVNGEELAAAAE
ncbi:trypsin-like peptidase domain-containing protein [Streptomyces sp. IBSBF 3010]|uniref:trypsin-like peptidase domain-containing protein n=1 Tax=Streptomyces sp. IBSBF 3010 TaxID=2903526 RepID=UPI002FDC7621